MGAVIYYASSASPRPSEAAPSPYPDTSSRNVSLFLLSLQRERERPSLTYIASQKLYKCEEGHSYILPFRQGRLLAFGIFFSFLRKKKKQTKARKRVGKIKWEESYIYSLLYSLPSLFLSKRGKREIRSQRRRAKNYIF